VGLLMTEIARRRCEAVANRRMAVASDLHGDRGLEATAVRRLCVPCTGEVHRGFSMAGTVGLRCATMTNRMAGTAHGSACKN